MKRLIISEGQKERLRLIAARFGLTIGRGTKAKEGSIDELNRLIADGYIGLIALDRDDLAGIPLLRKLSALLNLPVLEKLAEALEQAAELNTRREESEHDES